MGDLDAVPGFSLWPTWAWVLQASLGENQLMKCENTGPEPKGLMEIGCKHVIRNY